MINSNKIVYVIGAGRSGSTLIDIVLGNQSNFVSAGELNRFAKRKGFPHDPRDKEVAAFWENVRNDIGSLDSNVFKTFEKMEYHSSFFKNSFVKNNKSSYLNFNRKLFSSISKNIPYGSTIIDSSKYPLRGLYLSELFNKDISYIYIQRDPVNVVSSFQNKSVEQPSKSVFSSNVYLIVVNWLSNYVLNILRRNHYVVTIKYEDFCNDPISNLCRIENELKIDLTNVKLKISKGEKLNVGKLFDGNRLRLKNSIEIKKSKVNSKSLSGLIWRPFHRFFWYKFK